MINLECSVFTCAYYENQLCCRPEIHVGGQEASTPEETLCGSFRDHSSPDATNRMESFDEPEPSTDVSCDAFNCRYNEQGHCEAEAISVKSCSYNPQYGSETECATFSQK